MSGDVIHINEQPVSHVRGQTVDQAREAHRPGADLAVLNGFPVREPGTAVLQPGDRLVLIERGRPPAHDELANMMYARNTPGLQERLARACVGIAGVGGLGTNVAAALARIGVGRLILVDFDVVEPSNLNRQMFFVDQLGQYKTQAMADTLRRINPNTRVDTHETRLTPDNVPTLFAQADVIAECFDAADQKRMLIETVLGSMRDVPMVAVSGLAGHGDPNQIQVHRQGPRLWMVGDRASAAGPGMGLMAPRVFQAAGMEANTVLRILLGEE